MQYCFPGSWSWISILILGTGRNIFLTASSPRKFYRYLTLQYEVKLPLFAVILEEHGPPTSKKETFFYAHDTKCANSTNNSVVFLLRTEGTRKRISEGSATVYIINCCYEHSVNLAELLLSNLQICRSDKQQSPLGFYC